MTAPVSPPEPYPAQPAALTVRLLGDFALAYHGEPVTTVKTPRLQSLFAYLLLDRQATHARRQLAFLLWPDSAEGQALTNLRKQLLYLYQALPTPDSFLRIERGSVQWRPDAQVRLDVEEFERALNRAAGAQGDQARLALADAVTHYRGELFPDCYDEWIFPLRERLREQFVYGLERLVHLCEDRQLYGAAIEYAQRLLQHDPLRERSYRQLMRLYALNGDRALALRTYHTCVTQLNDELGVEPDGETQAAYERLLQHQPVEEEVRAVAAGAPLIGRQHEWQILQQQWRRAARGQAHFVLLTGEAGIGKTRLAEELLDWAWRQGIATARARSYAAEGRLAYAPVVEWLRSAAFVAKLQQVGTAWLPELARLLPELAANVSTGTRASPPQSWQRHRLFEALAQALLMGQEPRLLVIDDLQWCDQETLEWMRYFMRYALTARLLVVGTMRPEEVTGDHPLVTFVNEVRTAGQLTEIALGALTVEETTKLAEHLIASALDAATVTQLYAATEGHPLFVVEMVRAQGETSLQQVANGHNAGWTPADASAPPTPAPLPPKIHGVIAARLSRLSPAARQVATLAAVVGRAFSFAVLRTAGNGAEEALVDALDELWQRRIIREQGSSGYDFSHDKIREVIYTEISVARRRLFHRRVAEALETLYADQLDGVAAQLAAHFEQAGMVQKAIEYYQTAAKVAVRVYAYHDSIGLLRRALALLRNCPAGVERAEQEYTILVALGPPLIATMGYGYSELGRVYTRAQTLAEQLGLPSNPAILRVLAIYSIGSRRYQYAFYLGTQILELAQQGQGSQASILVVEGHYVLGVTLFWQGAFEMARQHLERALAAYDAKQSAAHISAFGQDPAVICHIRLAWVLWYLGYPDQAVEECKAALTRAQTLGHPFSLEYARMFALWLHGDMRNMAAVEQNIEMILAHTHQYQSRTSLPLALVLRGWQLAQGGAARAGIAQIQAGLETIRTKDNDGMYRRYYWARLAEAFAQTGDFEQASATLDEAMELLVEQGDRWYAAELYRLKGVLLDAQGAAPALVEAQFQQALDIARKQQAKSLELRAAMSLSQFWHGQGKRVETPHLLTDVYGWFTEGFDTPDLQEAQALLATLT